MMEWAWLAILIPLLSALFLGIFGPKLDKGPGSRGRWWAGFIATASVGLSFLVSLTVLLDYLNLRGEGTELTKTVQFFQPILSRLGIDSLPWIVLGTDVRSFIVEWKLLIDPLSLTMMLIVTGIGGLIHLYSTGYMADEDGYTRFFSYMNLFIAFMLTLVMAANLPVLFIGWEGVGLCSYLLIGYYFKSENRFPFAPGSAMKAFVVNRIGDFGVLLAMFWAVMLLSSLTRYPLDLLVLNKQLPALAQMPGYELAVTGITLLLFLGCTGKSAQIPLYIWLPDAMAGPTPVSALIHAATMVTAGVYLVVRLHPVFLASPTTLLVIAVIGAATALLAATIALTQRDIKKVLAYSTVSQLGYMFLATGVGAFWVAIFHLMTHAFFKACLFLGSGSVILGMAHEQDMEKMGGLKRYMPTTAWTYWWASAALAGIPIFAGFFSKDEILWKTFSASPGLWQVPTWVPKGLWAVGVITAFMTAFYIYRSYYKTFKGEERWKQYADELAAHAHHHGHGKGEEEESHGFVPRESGPAMRYVLVVLAIGSLLAGLIGLPAWLTGGKPNLFESWLGKAAGVKLHATAETSGTGVAGGWLGGLIKAGERAVIAPAGAALAAGEAEPGEEGSKAQGGGEFGLEVGLTLFSVIIALAGFFLAYKLYFPKAKTAALKARFAALYQGSLNKWYVDEIYDALVISPGKKLAYFFLRYVDLGLIDGLVNGTAAISRLLGDGLRRINTGYLRNYALAFVFGVLVLMGVVFLGVYQPWR